MNWCLCACIFHRVLKMILIWYLILNLSKNSLLDPVLSISTIRKKRQSENFVNSTLNQLLRSGYRCLSIHSGTSLYDLVCLKQSEPPHTIYLQHKSPKQGRDVMAKFITDFQCETANPCLSLLGLMSIIWTVTSIVPPPLSTLSDHRISVIIHVEKSQISSFFLHRLRQTNQHCWKYTAISPT